MRARTLLPKEQALVRDALIAAAAEARRCAEVAAGAPPKLNDHRSKAAAQRQDLLMRAADCDRLASELSDRRFELRIERKGARP